MSSQQLLHDVQAYRAVFKRLVWKSKPWKKNSPAAGFLWCKLAAIDEVTEGRPEAKRELVTFLSNQQHELDLEEQLRSVA